MKTEHEDPRLQSIQDYPWVHSIETSVTASADKTIHLSIRYVSQDKWSAVENLGVSIIAFEASAIDGYLRLHVVLD